MSLLLLLASPVPAPPPVIDPKFDLLDYMCAGSTFEFQDATTWGNPFTSMTWDFGDGAPSPDFVGPFSASIAHTFASAGTYTVSYTLQDAQGTPSNTATRQIHIRNCANAVPCWEPLVQDFFHADPNLAGTSWSIKRRIPADTVNMGWWDAAGEHFRLTTGTTDKAIAFASTTAMPTTQWQAHFRYRITPMPGPYGGADGIVFLFFKDTAGYTAGAIARGEAIGFRNDLQTSRPGYGAVFDAYQNSNTGDLFPNYIGFFKDNEATHLGTQVPTPITEDGIWHYVVIDYDGAGSMEVQVDGTVMNSLSGIVPGLLSGWGFSSSTGGGTAEHLLDDVSLLVPCVPVPSPPVADFLWVQPDPCYATIQFTDVSQTDPADTLIAWQWSFGDGGTSTLQNPTHTYSGPGPWTVSLKVTDDDFEDDLVSYPDIILCVPPVPQFTYELASPCDTHDPYILFTDTSYDPDPDGLVTGVHWNFGNGAYSYESNPYHTWGDVAGNFPVTLTAMDNYGTLASITQTVAFPGFVHCGMAGSDSQVEPAHPGDPRDGANQTLADDDPDDDGAKAALDTCPGTPNPDQKDSDLDGDGDLCDLDADGDGRLNEADLCWLAFDPTQDDLDGDGKGDACDLDVDGDEVEDAVDVCPRIADSQADADANGVGDACDTLTTTGGASVPLAAGAKAQRSQGDGVSPVQAAARLPASLLAVGALSLLAMLGVIVLAIVRGR